MQNRVARPLLGILCLIGNLVLAMEVRAAVSERELEESIDRTIGIFSDDVVRSTEDQQFVLSVPKEVIPLLIRRLEKERGTITKPSSAFGLLANKLKQYESEVPNEVRRAAVNLMVETCESANNEIALIYLLSFRGLKDPKITEMAARMRTRADTNVQRATARLLSSDPAPAPLAPATPTHTPAIPSTPVPMATVEPSPQPATPVVQTPATPVEQRAPVWPWVVGIAALTVIALLVWKRRA